MKKCLQCGYKWNERVANPATCSRCKRYDWNALKKKKKKKEEDGKNKQ